MTTVYCIAMEWEHERENAFTEPEVETVLETWSTFELLQTRVARIISEKKAKEMTKIFALDTRTLKCKEFTPILSEDYEIILQEVLKFESQVEEEPRW